MFFHVKWLLSIIKCNTEFFFWVFLIEKFQGNTNQEDDWCVKWCSCEINGEIWRLYLMIWLKSKINLIFYVLQTGHIKHKIECERIFFSCCFIICVRFDTIILNFFFLFWFGISFCLFIFLVIFIYWIISMFVFKILFLRFYSRVLFVQISIIRIYKWIVTFDCIDFLSHDHFAKCDNLTTFNMYYQTNYKWLFCWTQTKSFAALLLKIFFECFCVFMFSLFIFT